MAYENPGLVQYDRKNPSGTSFERLIPKSKISKSKKIKNYDTGKV
jgi:hypothetical protein